MPPCTKCVCTTVNKLKVQLSKFAKLQKDLEEKLEGPVPTTIEVTAGEPGLLGKRGPRSVQAHIALVCCITFPATQPQAIRQRMYF